MTAPCKDCQDRELKCHATCDRYKEFRQKRDDYNTYRFQAQEEVHDIMTIRVKPMARVKNKYVRQKVMATRFEGK